MEENGKMQMEWIDTTREQVELMDRRGAQWHGGCSLCVTVLATPVRTRVHMLAVPTRSRGHGGRARALV